ncbi:MULTISPECIES: small basic family protein [Clostridia]|uniref:small basic family protein n=1 Tax=Clostridia TaxID=186801 RepID=UPI0004B3922C|nr:MULTISPECIES: small basic family protein [Clostridia]MBO3443273.1 small basic family protein [Clostridium sp. CCUG 7971]
MIWILAGLALGVVVGYYIPFTYTMDYSLYMSVAILATMDSIFGAVKSGFEGKYDNIIFITGFIGNALLAIILTYIGDRLGLPLYYVAILVFGSRLFDNLSIIRRHIIANLSNKKRGK